jgi:hypothetical protein
MTVVPGLADEGERKSSGQCDGGRQRHARGLGTDDHVDTELPGEPGTPDAEVPQKHRVGKGALQ